MGRTIFYSGQPIGAVSVKLYCPPMAIYGDGPSLKRTAAEPMKASLTFDNGLATTIDNVIIPPTEVRRLHRLYWEVDACVGQGGGLQVYLPKEAAVWRFSAMSMVALSIVAKTVLTMPDGSVWQGQVTFPDCRIEIAKSPMIAEAITATGTLELAQ